MAGWGQEQGLAGLKLARTAHAAAAAAGAPMGVCGGQTGRVPLSLALASMGVSLNSVGLSHPTDTHHVIA